jgi:CCR4-NOT transcription complex subunit 2
MSSPNITEAEQARHALIALSAAVREMTPIGTKSIPAAPERFNLLARPHQNVCRICNLPGHQSSNVNKAAACRTAMLSLLDFWEDQAEEIKFLYSAHIRFKDAIAKNRPTYDMRLDNVPQVRGDMETVVVDQLTRNYLKFQAWVARVRAKINVILDMEGADGEKYELLSQVLNDILLKGKTRGYYPSGK